MLNNVFKIAYVIGFLLVVNKSFSQAIRQIPLKVYSSDGISIKSYDFNNLEPMLNKANDTIYVVNFWATWCGPCVKELPYFDKAAKDYKHNKVKVLLVSLDMAKEAATKLIPFIKRKKVASEVVHLYDPDADSWISRVDPEWSGALPATLIYTSGRRKFFEKSFTEDSLLSEIETFINLK